MKPLFIKYPRCDFRDNTGFFDKNKTEFRKTGKRTRKRGEIIGIPPGIATALSICVFKLGARRFCQVP